MKASRTGGGLRAQLRSFDDWRRTFDLWRARNAKQNSDPRNYTPDSALQLPPVLGAVQVLAKAAAAAKLTIQEKVGGVWQPTSEDLPRWADPNRRPNKYQSQYEWRFNWAMNHLVGGNGYMLALTEADGFPDQMVSVPGGIVSVRLGGREVGVLDERPPAGVQGEDQLEYYVDGNTYQPFTALTPGGDMMHSRMITGPSLIYGQSPLMLGAPAMRAGLAAEAHAELFFQTGGIPPGILAAEGKGQINQETIEAAERHYKRIRENPDNRFAPLFLSGPWKFLSTFVNPEQMQLIDSRKFTFANAAALYGVPPPLFGGPDMTTWGQGVRQLMRFFVQHSVAPLLIQYSGLMSEALPDDLRCVVKPDHLLEGEPLEEARYLERLVSAEIMLRSEARQKIGLPEVDGIDDRPLPAGDPDRGGDSDSGRNDGTENNMEDMQ